MKAKLVVFKHVEVSSFALLMLVYCSVESDLTQNYAFRIKHILNAVLL